MFSKTLMLRMGIILFLYLNTISAFSFSGKSENYFKDFKCEFRNDLTIGYFENSNLFALVASNDSPVCGDSTQTVTLSASGSNPLNNIVWYDENDNIVGNGNPLIFTNVTSSLAGNYYAIEYSLGLVITQISNVTNVEVSEISSDNAYAGEDQFLCHGTSVTNLAGEAPVEGVGFWTADASNSFLANIVNPTLPNTLISDLATGVYTFRWTLSNGACSNYDYDEVTIIVGDVLPAPTYFGDIGVCNGELLFLQGNGAPAGAIYHWEGPNGFSSDDQNLFIESANINNAGLYEVSYITAEGCQSLSTEHFISIYTFADFPAIIFDGPICMGDTLKLDSPTTGLVYEWIGPDGEAFSTLANPFLTTATNFTEIPFGEDPYKSGFWKVRVTDNNGCKAVSDSINVVINSLPNTPLIESPSNICAGDDLEFQASLVPNATYNWYQTVNGNSDSVLVSQQQNPIITGLASIDENDDPYEFCLKLNVNGCESTLEPELNALKQACVGLADYNTYSIPFSGANNITFSNVGGALWQMDYVHTGGNIISQTMENVWNDTTSKGGTLQFNVIFSSGGGKVRLELIKDANWTSFTRDGDNYSIQFLYLSNPEITGYLKYFIICPEYTLLGHNTPNFDGTEYTTYINRMIFQTVQQIESQLLSDGLACRAVRVSNPPNINPTHNGGICGDSLRLFSNVENDFPPYSFSWTGPNGFVSFDENPVISNPDFNDEGTYVLSITDSLGCSNMGTVNVEIISSSVNEPIITSNSPLCEGDNLMLNTLQLEGDSINYSWYGPNGKSTLNGDYPNSPIVIIENITTSDIGNYSVIVMVNNCTSISSANHLISINENPQVNILDSSDIEMCVSDTSSIHLNADASDGEFPYVFNWQGPNDFESNVGNVLLENLSEEKSGTYSIQITDGNGCQSAIESVNLNFLSQPDFPIITQQGTTCFGDQLILSVPNYSGTNVNYKWFLDGVSLNNNSNILFFNSVTLANSGMYELVVNVNGCDSDTSSFEININPKIELTLTDINLNCENGNNDLNLSAIVSGGSGEYNYLWTGPNGFFSTNATPIIYNVNSSNSGSYILKITDSLGCESIVKSMFVNIVEQLESPNLQSVGVVCEGDKIILSTQVYTGNGISYHWFFNGNEIYNNTNTLLIDPATSADLGIYKVFILKNGCSTDTAQIEINVNENISVTFSNQDFLCLDVGADTTLLANVTGGTPPYSFVWTGPNGFISNLENPVIGNYFNNPVNIFSVTVTDSLGCISNTASAVIRKSNQPNQPFINPVGTICHGDILKLETQIYTETNVLYQWKFEGIPLSNNSNQLIIDPVTNANSGVYEVSVIVDGCESNSSNISISVNDPILAAIDIGSTNCINPSTNLTLNNTITGGNEPYNYLWTGPNGFISTSENPTLTNVNDSQSGVYTLVVTDDLGCQSPTLSETIFISQGVNQPIISSNGTTCEGETLILSTPAVNGTNVNFTWITPNGISTNMSGFGTNELMINSLDGMYEGNYVIEINADGCVAISDSFYVEVFENVGVNPTSSLSSNCSGGKLYLFANAVGTDLTYSWTGPNGFISALENPIINNISSDNNGQYILTVTNVNGCLTTSTTHINEILVDPTTPSISSNSPICEGDILTFSSTATGVNFEWIGPLGSNDSILNNTLGLISNNASTSIDFSSNAYLSGTWQMRMTDANGCTSISNEIDVTINPLPISQAFNVAPVCFGEEVQLNSASVNSGNYEWRIMGNSDLISTDQNPIISNLTDTTSLVLTVNANGCISQILDTIEVAVIPKTEISITPISPIECTDGTESVQLNIESNDDLSNFTYLWLGPNGFTSTLKEPILSNLNTSLSGTYIVYGVSPDGCKTNTASVEIIITNGILKPIISSTGSVCENGNVLLQVPIYSGINVIYDWTLNGNMIPSTNNGVVISSATVDDSGDYQVTVTVDGCTNVSNIYTLNVFEKPTVAPNNDGSLCANLSSDLNLMANPSGGIAPYNYSWTGPNGFSSNDENPNLPNANVSFSGTYNITITDAVGCSTMASTVVEITNQPIIPALNLISDEFLCEGEILELSTNSYNGISVVYHWITPSGNMMTSNPSLILDQVNSINHDGIYSVSIEVEGCISQNSPQVNIEIVPTPSVPIIPNDFEICENETLILSTTTVAETYVWTGPNGFYSTLQNPINIDPATPLESGTYQLVVADFGCESLPSQVEVEVNAAPSMPTIFSNAPICNGEDLVFSTGVSQTGFTYEWISPLGDDSTILANTGLTTNISNTIITSSNIAYLSGNWQVRITDSNGCSSESLEMIEVDIHNLPPNPTASSNSPKCVGEAIQLFAGEVIGANYLWYDSDPSASPAGILISTDKDPVFYNLDTGTHSFWLKIEKDGCESEIATMTEVVINSIPQINGITNSSTYCEGEEIQIVAPNFANGIFSWTGPNGFQSFAQNLIIPSASPANSGVYNLQVEVDGCASNTVSTFINVLPQPEIPIVNNNGPACEGTDIQLFSSSSSIGQVVEYLWTGPNGFTSNVQNPILSAATTAVSGEYQLELTVDGCSSLISLPTIVEVSPQPDLPVVDNNTITNVICEGDDVFLISNFIAGANYFWTGPNGFNSTFQNPVINEAGILDTGLYFLTIEISGCSSVISQPTQVNIATIPDAPIAINDGPVCEGNAISLIVPSASLGVTYSWYQSSTNLLMGIGDTLILTNISQNQAGEYYVIANENGCDSEPSFATEIIVNNSPNQNAFAGDDFELCGETTTTLNATSPMIGTGIWTNLGNAIIVNPTSPTSPVFNLEEGQNIFIWTLSNGDCDNFSSDTVIVFRNILTNDIADAGLNQNLCGGSEFNLSAMIPNQATGLWTQPNIQESLGIIIADPTNPNTIVTGANPGNTYVFYWSLTNGGCENYSVDEILISIDEPSQDLAYAGEDQFHCGESSLILTATTPLQGEGIWTTNGDALIITPTSSTAQIINLQEGENVFYWTLSNGSCTNFSMDSITVMSLEKPTAIPDVDTLLWNTTFEEIEVSLNDDYRDFEVEVSLFSSPANGVVEVNNNGTIKYTPNENFIGTEYFEYLICNANCPIQCDIAEVEIIVTQGVISSAVDCFAPTIITPNGDGVNDAFVIPCLANHPNSSLKIFNRWGDQVYGNKSYENNWKGTFDGFPLPDGSYYYILNLDGNPKNILSGYIIIRN